MSQESMRTLAGVIPTHVTATATATAAGTAVPRPPPTEVSTLSHTAGTGQKDYYRVMAETVTRITKEEVFCSQQFVMSDKVMDINGIIYRFVMKKAKKDPDDTGSHTYWLVGGKKVVEKTINRQRQAVVLRVKKRFAGKGLEYWELSLMFV